MRTPKPHRQIPTLDARTAVRIRIHVQLSPRETRRWAEELRRSPMTVIRKCRNRATPKVFTNASKGKKGSLAAHQDLQRKTRFRNRSSRQCLGSGSRGQREREGQRQEQVKPALPASQTPRGSLTCDE